MDRRESDPKRRAAEERQRRLAAALRANLRKRKASRPTTSDAESVEKDD
jgi:hypothetical protein